jgi:hypothetical protein
MFKKIIVGVLVVGLVGILALGALNRMASVTGSAEARGQGRGKSGDALTTYTTNGNGQGGGGYGQGRGNGTGDQAGTGLAPVTEWVSLQGVVVSADQNALVVKTDDGGQVTVENRPWLFAQEQGFSVQVGDQVALTGFYEGSDLEVGQITDSTNGKIVLLRDESGRPGWAGRGQRGG